LGDLIVDEMMKLGYYPGWSIWFSDKATAWTIRDSNPGRGKLLSSQNVQAGSGAHPDSCSICSGVPARVYRSRAVNLTANT